MPDFGRGLRGTAKNYPDLPGSSDCRPLCHLFSGGIRQCSFEFRQIQARRGDRHLCKTLGAKKIGVISCSGLAKETRHFISYLKEEGIYCQLLCDLQGGAVAKEGEIGLPESVKTKDRPHDSICTPVLQAYILEREKTDLNVIIGLCIDHDSLFIRHSIAPVAHLIGKNQVHEHNPTAAVATLQ